MRDSLRQLNRLAFLAGIVLVLGAASAFAAPAPPSSPPPARAGQPAAVASPAAARIGQELTYTFGWRNGVRTGDRYDDAPRQIRWVLWLPKGVRRASLSHSWARYPGNEEGGVQTAGTCSEIQRRGVIVVCDGVLGRSAGFEAEIVVVPEVAGELVAHAAFYAREIEDPGPLRLKFSSRITTNRRSVTTPAAPPSSAAPSSSAAPRPLSLGVFGNAVAFAGLTGQRPGVGHSIVGWGQGHSWGSRFRRLLRTMGPTPMLGIGMKRFGREAINSRGIALGAGDDYLVALNRAVAEWRGPIYVRPFAEMNGHWNVYCAYNQNGSARDDAHSTAWFRKAFARVHIIVHGAADANAQLRGLGLPAVRQSLTPNPMPRVRVIWNPQGYGNPDLAGNSAQAYYPGDPFVDVVGNDLYNMGGKAEWAANEALYRAHPDKPYAIPEWGNWGIDDPSFVIRMAEFARTHRRVELLAYYNGPRGSIWDLGTKPRSRAAYRAHIAPLGSG